MPLATMLSEATLSGGDASIDATLSMNRIAWSCILGQIANVSLICYLEWLTSHGCRPVRNLSKATVERVPLQNLNYAHYLGEFGGFGCFFIMAVLIIVVYNLAGWSGFMAAACGFLINLVIYIPIFYVGC
jgi:Na+/H+-translocating membrane pyrophosphatase